VTLILNCPNPKLICNIDSTRTIQRSGLGSVGRITALDPAKPWFDGSNRPQRISKSDADFVDVIHTNSGSITDVSGRGFLPT
jgi:hypothetical protein